MYHTVCPYCGKPIQYDSRWSLHDDDNDKLHYVHCDCAAVGPRYHKDEAYADYLMLREENTRTNFDKYFSNITLEQLSDYMDQYCLSLSNIDSENLCEKCSLGQSAMSVAHTYNCWELVYWLKEKVETYE